MVAEAIMDEKDLMVPDVPIVSLDDEFDSDLSKIDDQIPKVKAEEAKVVLNLISQSCSSSTSNNSDTDPDATLAGSLEDLVSCFDDKVKNVLKDLKEDTNQMAPVQIRTQDEIMSESQVWYTLTGNYGNILPLDFNKTHIRKNEIESLNLSTRSNDDINSTDAGYDGENEDELKDKMDLHQLISQQIPTNNDIPPITADQVIEEIDEIMQTCDLIHSITTDRTIESVDSMYSSMRSPFTSTTSQTTDNEYKNTKNNALNLTAEDLSNYPQSKLLTLMAELEQLIVVYNNELVRELALRDEMIYDKEIKNKFITLVVDIQDKRRKIQNSKKKKLLGKLDTSNNNNHLSTSSIPYDDNTLLDTPTLESMIKILEAINNDSPQVPNLLTEYILTVICPSTETSMIA